MLTCLFRIVRLLGLTTLLLSIGLMSSVTASEKIVDRILFPHDPSADGIYRWSEASTISLDGKKHLMMLVTAFGHGGHDDTASDILEFHSHDAGVTWTPLDLAKIFQKNFGKANVMSPSLLRLNDGDLLCFFMLKNKSWVDSGTWMRRSTDNAKTWSKPERLPYKGYGGLGCDRAVQTSSGRILLPSWVSLDRGGSTHAYCHYSDDQGKTWKQTALISAPKGSTNRRTDPAAEEPTIIELKDGRLMMFIRVYLKSIYVSYSNDDGTTWSKPRSSGIPSPGSMATIRRMPDGNILLIWNWAPAEKIKGPFPRTFITAAVSTDEGENFSYVRHLDGAADFAGKITMANVIFTDDHAVITYSKSMSMKNAYNWRQQVIPIKWFYQGDTTQVYGEKYLPTLKAKLAARKTAAAKPKSVKSFHIPRPTVEQRKQAFAANENLVKQAREEQHLIAAYSFEEESGAFAFDHSQGGNHLAMTAIGDQTVSSKGKQGQALTLNGKNGILMSPDAKTLRLPSNELTVEAWVFPTANKICSLIASKEHVFEVGLLEGRLQAAVSCGKSWGNGSGWRGRTAIPLNRWTHIAVTFDGASICFFLDGKQVEAVARPGKLDVTTEPLVVGGSTHIADATFAGRIDELRIWNSVRYKSRPRSTRQRPRKVSRDHQLFLDDGLIASVDGLQQVVNQPVRHHVNPVLTWDKPWEGNCVIAWGSVLYDKREEQFKVWYQVYKKFPANGERSTLLCYATSTDGVHWRKPTLGLLEYDSSKANNIVFLGDGSELDSASVLLDPHPTEQSRYRMYWYDAAHDGIRAAVSPDGIRWKPIEGVVVKSGDRSTVTYDHRRKRFSIITRQPASRIPRTCVLWESEDGLNFSLVGEIAAVDADDAKRTDLYGMIAFPYEGMQIGFLEMFYDRPLRKLNTQLMYCHTGHTWERACDRQTFLDWGPPGSWDQAWVTPSHNPPIRVGDKLYIFYQGRSTLHYGEKPYGHIGSIGLAYLRVDGFVSLDSIWKEGTVTTAPLLLEGQSLHVNTEARPGTVFVEVTNLDGEPFSGFTRDDCQPLHGIDSINSEIKWRSGHSLAELAGQPVRLRFYVQGAKLYSFWVE